MLLTTFDPFTQDFDRLVQRTFGWSGGNAGGRSATVPMDVIRRENDVELRLDLPGADPESIEVTADRGVLTVSATRTQEFAEGERPVVRERLTGTVTRKVRLAETVDAEAIEASYDRGVLTVLLPLQEKAKPRKIEIKRPGKAEITA
ncbi:MAG TPA: Hsp20/alpha crystallin family protein [Streptosporangiaceae bacterium]